MLKFIAPVIFILASVAIFLGYIDKVYGEIKELKAQEQSLDSALDNSLKFKTMLDALGDKYKSISNEDLNKIEKMLPGHVDNIRLIRDIDGIATRFGMFPRGMEVNVSEEKNKIGSDGNSIGKVTVSFSVASPYRTFVELLGELEKSLRIMDVTSISFSSSEQDMYEFSITLQTYWLKQ